MIQDTRYQQDQKFEIIKIMFMDPACQNYVVARWCFQMRLNIDFLWNAVHSLEKAMKAVLLNNGESAKDDGHNITKLYDRVADIAGDFLPDKLVKPNEIDKGNWRDENAKTFLRRLYNNGGPENRYHVYKLELFADDLYKLDQVYFAIFRLCCPLDLPFSEETCHGQRDTTRRKQLENNPNLIPDWEWTRLKELMEDNKPEIMFAAKNENFPFAPNFEHIEKKYGSYMQTPVLRRKIVDPYQDIIDPYQDIIDPYQDKRLGEDPRQVAELTTWVLKNIKLPPKLQRKFEEIRDCMKSRS